VSAPDDPFRRHRAEVETSIRSGDPAAIKQSYRDLGSYLHDAYGDGDQMPPQLSWPETAAVVAGAIPPEAVRVLDAGCGPNPATAIAVHRPDRLVIALDIGLGTVRLACATGRARDRRLAGVVADVEHLPLRTGCLDAVICDDTIEHVPDDRAVVRELARCLRLRGVVVVATPNRLGLQVLYRRAKDRIRGRRLPPRAYFATSSHLREYTPGELGRLLAPDFVVDRFLRVGWAADSPAKRIANDVVRWWPFRLFTRVVVAVGTPRRRSDA
jgi:SAM-dependent methyltransferase